MGEFALIAGTEEALFRTNLPKTTTVRSNSNVLQIWFFQTISLANLVASWATGQNIWTEF